MDFQKFRESLNLQQDAPVRAREGALVLLREDMKRGWWALIEQGREYQIYQFMFYTHVSGLGEEMKDMLSQEIKKMVPDHESIFLKERNVAGARQIALSFTVSERKQLPGEGI